MVTSSLGSIEQLFSRSANCLIELIHRSLLRADRVEHSVLVDVDHQHDSHGLLLTYCGVLRNNYVQ